MVKEYRKIATIKAEQFSGTKQMIDKYKIFTDVEHHLEGSNCIVESVDPYEIDTLEGIMSLRPDDWIATGVEGEHWVIRDDIFRKTYKETRTKNILYYVNRQKQLAKFIDQYKLPINSMELSINILWFLSESGNEANDINIAGILNMPVSKGSKDWIGTEKGPAEL